MAPEEFHENKRQENNIITLQTTIRQQPNMPKITILLIKKTTVIWIINIIIPHSA